MQHFILFPQKAFHPVFIFLLQIKEKKIIACSRDLNRLMLCLIINFLHRQLPFQDLLHKPPPGKLLIFLDLILELGAVILLLLILLDLLLQLQKHIFQLHPGNRLQQILIDPHFNGLPCIFEIVIPADDNDLHPGKFPAHDFAQGKPIHKWHFYIRDQHIRLCFTDQGQSHFSICSFSYKTVSELVPGNPVPEPLTDHRLIFNQKYLQ